MDKRKTFQLICIIPNALPLAPELVDKENDVVRFECDEEIYKPYQYAQEYKLDVGEECFIKR